MKLYGHGRLTDTAKTFTYGADKKLGASFTIASKEYVGKDATSLEAKYETTFIDVTIYGRDAEYVKNHIGKGDEVFVEGNLKTSSWIDKTSGQNRSKLFLNADTIKLVSKVGVSSVTNSNETASAVSASTSITNDEEISTNDEEIPF